MAHNLISKKELFIVIAIVIVSIFVYLFISSKQAAGEYAQIIVRNTDSKYISLKNDITYVLPGNPNVILKVENGYFFFKNSDCPDQICVNTGRINRAGQSIACLPNFVSVIIIKENNENAIDIIAY